MRTFSGESGGFGINLQMTSGVKWLLIVNTAAFVVGAFSRGLLDFWFGLTPALVMKGFIWQLFTYQFLHAGVAHILFNMLALWMFGTVIEGTWGRQRFLRYYFICATGAGVCVFLAGLFGSGYSATTVGASGAIFGLLLAFGVMYPNAPILLFFLFPVPAKYAVIIYGAIEFFFFTSGLKGVSTRSLDLRYKGQGFELNVPYGTSAVSAFHEAHRQRYGYADPARPIEVVNVRARFVAASKPLEFRKHVVRRGNANQAVVARRSDKTCGNTVYDRALLRAGDAFSGPAVVAEYSATTVVPRGAKARVDGWGNIVIEVAHV